MSAIEQLHKTGQSLWYDNIQRRLLESGELASLIERGDIRGITSNPSIFHQAISKSQDYDAALKPMAWSGWSSEQIFFQLAVEDIRVAADLFRPLYEQSNGEDGYVSLEVSPLIANDTQATESQVKQLWDWVQRPNLMIKIPATPEGIPAIRAAIAAGVNVNVTLIFSLARYRQVIEAYFEGLEDRLARGLSIDRIASVASFFVSRLDTKVDAWLQRIIQEEGVNAPLAISLLGKAAIANAHLAYALFREAFTSQRFETLRKHGARLQRPLWASTSTKNPAYRDVLYVEELIAPDTVNTVPPQTLEAFRDHGKVEVKLSTDTTVPRRVMEQLGELGISIDQATQELEIEGVKAFADAFIALLSTLDQRRQQALRELGVLQQPVAERIAQLKQINAVQRVHQQDAALWTNDPQGQEEIKKRLGWLNAPYNSQQLIRDFETLLHDCSKEGYTHVVILGMGGSSLSPEVFATTFPAANQQALHLLILDSTDPEQVKAITRQLPMEKTLYIVSSKSGTTSEPNALLAYFWEIAQNHLGEKARRHFIAITDPGTPLEKLAKANGFRQVFLADPNVGGRYSVFTTFGLLPATLAGVNVPKLIERAAQMAKQCTADFPAERNPGLVLGAVLGTAALHGRDKVTLLLDPEIATFGSWLEQLLAESSGKEGKGLVPVDLEPLVPAKYYSHDRIFVYLAHSNKYNKIIERLQKAGHPALILSIRDLYDLGAEFYRWEFATAIACAVLRVNAFDQPDVQDSKTRTEKKIFAFLEKGALEEATPIWQDENFALYGTDQSITVGALPEILQNFLTQLKPGDYLAINAYLPRNRTMLAKLQKIRRSLLKRTGNSTTLGFGPRFLHSTGQLHKGGANNGVFIQITAEPDSDLSIPGRGYTFGVLEKAQALGDFEALQSRQRRAIRIHLKNRAAFKELFDILMNL
jgi:transaldolase/glucose-6-phosphate isomerase